MIGDIVVREADDTRKKVRVTVPRAETRVNRSGTSKFAAFIISIDLGQDIWQVERRYSALFDFHSKAQARGLEAISGRGFPGKVLIGTGLTTEQDAKRLQALESYLQAVCAADETYFLESFCAQDAAENNKAIIQISQKAREEEQEQLAARKTVLEAQVRRLSKLEAQLPSARKIAACLILRVFLGHRPGRAFYKWYTYKIIRKIDQQDTTKRLQDEIQELNTEKVNLQSQLKAINEQMTELQRKSETQLIKFDEREKNVVIQFEQEALALRHDLESRLDAAISENEQLKASLATANKRADAAESLAAVANRNLEAEISAESTRAGAQANLALAIDEARVAHEAELTRLRAELDETRNRHAEAMEHSARSHAIETQTWLQNEIIRVQNETNLRVAAEFETKLENAHAQIIDLNKVHEAKLAQVMIQFSELEKRALTAEKHLLDTNNATSSSVTQVRTDFERIQAATEENHKSHIERLKAQHDDTLNRQAKKHAEECATLQNQLAAMKNELDHVAQAKTTAEARAYFAFADADNLAQAKVAAESRAHATLIEAQNTKLVADESLAQAKESNRVAQHKINQLEARLQTALNDIESSKSIAASAVKERTESEAKFAADIAEIEAQQKTALADIDIQHTKEVRELETKVQNAQAQAIKLQAELEALIQSESETKLALTSREEASTDLESRLSIATKENSELRSSISATERRAEAAEAMAAAANRNLEAELSAGTSRAAAQTSLANAINDTRAEFDRLLSSAQASHKVELDRLETELRDACERESQIRTELEAARSTLNTLGREKAAAETKAHIAFNDAERVRMNANELVQAKAAAEMRADMALAEAKAARANAENLSKAAAEARAQATLSQGESTSSHSVALSEAQAKIAETESRLATAERAAAEQYQELETRHASVIAESNQLRESLDQVSTRAEIAEKDAVAARAELDRFLTESLSMQQEEAEKQAKYTETLNALQLECAEAKAANIRLKEANYAAEERAHTALENLRDLTQSKNMIEAERDGALTDVASARTVADELRRQFLYQEDSTDASRDNAQLRVDFIDLESKYKSEVEAYSKLTASLQAEVAAIDAKYKIQLEESQTKIKRLEADHTALGVKQIKCKADLDLYSKKFQDQADREVELLQYAVDLRTALNSAISGNEPTVPKAPNFITSNVPSPLMNVDIKKESFSMHNISDLAVKVARQPLSQLWQYKATDAAQLKEIQRGLTTAATKAVANSNISEISNLAINVLRDLTSDDTDNDLGTNFSLASCFHSTSNRSASIDDDDDEGIRNDDAIENGIEETKQQEVVHHHDQDSLSPTVVRYTV
uniref:PX domain-containing protein n=1 Tax=Aureoumbra lagunensis TaxID=44058 RepID=A0A7S3K4X0_9STRA|mmetsp:Transcript_14968/g.22532  ORF Transcript_14968/g.22532 Transcript_14968/m.22532 type:complete len:1326 (+) Transcript_14968:42-4019(+)